MDGMMGGMALWMLLWGLVAVAILVLATVGVIWLVRNTAAARREGVREDTPEDMLRRRYAAGEIDEDDFLRRQAGLTGH